MLDCNLGCLSVLCLPTYCDIHNIKLSQKPIFDPTLQPVLFCTVVDLTDPLYIP